MRAIEEGGERLDVLFTRTLLKARKKRLERHTVVTWGECPISSLFHPLAEHCSDSCCFVTGWLLQWGMPWRGGGCPQCLAMVHISAAYCSACGVAVHSPPDTTKAGNGRARRGNRSARRSAVQISDSKRIFESGALPLRSQEPRGGQGAGKGRGSQQSNSVAPKGRDANRKSPTTTRSRFEAPKGNRF